MSLCIRYLNKFEVFERFLGFINVSENQKFTCYALRIGCNNILSNKLQIKTETLGHAANTIVGVIETFEDDRNSACFAEL